MIKQRNKIIFAVFFLVALIFGEVLVSYSNIYAYTYSFNLTEEESLYIESNPSVNVLMFEGIEPLEFIDNSGNPSGISVSLLNEISEKTGFQFNYIAADSFETAQSLIDEGKVDMISCVSSRYSSDYLSQYPVSKPYLSCRTLLYFNSNIDTNDFTEKIYASTKEKQIPENVNDNYVQYYDTIEDCLSAIEKGKADYSYGNEFSISYFIVKNGYHNIMTIPTEQETIEYNFLYINQDPVFSSILNRILDSISTKDMQSIIIKGSMEIGRNVTLSLVIRNFKFEFLLIIAAFLIIMICFTFIIYRTAYKIRVQKKRFTMLYEVADEYMFEYDYSKKKLDLSEKCRRLLKDAKKIQLESKTINCKHPGFEITLGTYLRTMESGVKVLIQIDEDESRIFRVTKAEILTNRQQKLLILGKLEDITKDTYEKEQLRQAARRDSMTGLLNAGTCRKEILRRLEESPGNGFIIIMDIDNFKNVNDTYGHAEGDRIICAVADILSNSFRSYDIVGRVGGDEFCVYMDKAKQPDVERKLQLLQTKLKDIGISVSMGAVKTARYEKFENLYKNADDALYKSKQAGKNRYSFYTFDYKTMASEQNYNL